jgi:hypothetical protein
MKLHRWAIVFLVRILVTTALLLTSLIEGAVATPARGPLKIHPVNPRYFTDGTDKAVYLTGSHHWNNLVDTGEIGHALSVFDYSRYLEFLESHNHNFMRMWTWVGGVNKTYADLFPFRRTGPGTALDGKPKFDLDTFNEEYFNRLRSRVIDAQDRGIYVSIMFFNGWSINDNGIGDPWPFHPFNAANNINGVDGASDEGEKIAHTLRLPAITDRQKELIRKIIDTVNDLDNVLYEISNEERSSADNTTWQEYMINYAHDYERTKPKQHPVGMTVQWPKGHNQVLYESPADWISPNAHEQYDVDPPATTTGKVVISDTDHLFGVGGDDSWVWKTFMRGLNPIYMDPLHFLTQSSPDPVGAEKARKALGYTRSLANRLDLAYVSPRPDLSSTRYCLANPDLEYLVYLPLGSHWLAPYIERLPYWAEQWIISRLYHSVSVDLSEAKGTMTVEWFNPSTGETLTGGATSGGASRDFTAPFAGDAVLYLKA